jgi:hypothetical protein
MHSFMRLGLRTRLTLGSLSLLGIGIGLAIALT